MWIGLTRGGQGLSWEEVLEGWSFSFLWKPFMKENRKEEEEECFVEAVIGREKGGLVA